MRTKGGKRIPMEKQKETNDSKRWGQNMPAQTNIPLSHSWTYPRCSGHVSQNEVPLTAAAADGGGHRQRVRVLPPPPCGLQASFQLFWRGPLDPSSSIISCSFYSPFGFSFALRLVVEGADEEADKGGKRGDGAAVGSTASKLLNICNERLT
jgi:hypothetical protein